MYHLYNIVNEVYKRVLVYRYAKFLCDIYLSNTVRVFNENWIFLVPILLFWFENGNLLNILCCRMGSSIRFLIWFLNHNVLQEIRAWSYVNEYLFSVFSSSLVHLNLVGHAIIVTQIRRVSLKFISCKNLWYAIK